MSDQLAIRDNPVLPVLTMVPLSLLFGTVLFDLAAMISGIGLFSQVAYWNLGMGTAGVVAAVVVGRFDLRALPPGSPARSTADGFVKVNLTVLLLFGTALLGRMGAQDHAAGAGMFAVQLLGLAGAAVAAQLGGQVVRAQRRAPGRLRPRPGPAGGRTGGPVPVVAGLQVAASGGVRSGRGRVYRSAAAGPAPVRPRPYSTRTTPPGSAPASRSVPATPSRSGAGRAGEWAVAAVDRAVRWGARVSDRAGAVWRRAGVAGSAVAGWLGAGTTGKQQS